VSRVELSIPISTGWARRWSAITCAAAGDSSTG
jgi:hypothetical protein